MSTHGVDVCVVIGSLEVGGTERHLLQVLPALVRRGLRCMVSTLTHAGPLAEAMRDGGVTVIAPPHAERIRRLPRGPRRAVAWPVASVALVDTLRRHRPALVHHHLPAAYLVGVPCAALAGVPRQLMSRRCLNVYQAKYPVLARIERTMHGRMRAIVGNSRAIVGELTAEGAPPERIALVPNGVTLERFANLPDRDSARDRLELPRDGTVAVMVANLNHHKGHADVLDALGGLRERLPKNFMLVCAGRDDGIGRDLAERARGLGIGDRVRWIGPRNDVPAVLAAADLAISASHQEGSSNAVLEAMATGLPVIGTAIGGTPEAVTDGVHGRLVPPCDPAALGEAVAALIADPAMRRTMGERAAIKIRSEYAMEACVDRYVAIYGAVLADKPLPASVRA